MSEERPMSRPLSPAIFALATLAPVTLMALGWAGAALVWMILLGVVLDQVMPLVAADAPDGAEFPGDDALLVTIGIAALGVLPAAVWALTLPGVIWHKVALFLTAGFWLGQVAHPAAHELIHRADRRLFRLGVAVYCALLIGHHASSHRLVHHRHVATQDDPATAASGTGFYRFALRAGAAGFVQGFRAENALRRGRGLHPYAVYLAGAALALTLAAVIGGWFGVAVWAGLALHAQAQIHLSDYVQHYGLVRRVQNGRIDPVGPAHSWNATPWFSAALLLNAPRHSDHHAHPARPYPALRLPNPDQAPRLPWPLPVACLIALVPPLWRRLMWPHVARWRDVAKP